MKARSITGPVLLVIVGSAFLVNNIWHDIPLWKVALEYWPLLLIAIGVVGLFEALYYASRGVPNPPRPLAGGGIFWLVMLVAFFSWADTTGNLQFGPFSHGIGVFGTDYTYSVSAAGQAHGVTRVVIDGLRGIVKVEGQDAGGDVKVTGKKSVRAMSKSDADKADGQSPYRVDREGDLLYIRIADPKDSDHVTITGELEIWVPKGIDVEVQGRNGDLTIEGISGGVTVASGRGDVRVSDVGKDVKVESNRSGLIRVASVKGKVDLEGPKGGDVEIENIAGDVSVQGEYGGSIEFRNLTKSLHFVSQASDLHLEGVPGSVKLDSGDLKITNVVGPLKFHSSRKDVTIEDLTGSLELTVDHGDVQVTQTKTPLAKMDIHSHNGEITLALPEKAAFDVNLRTSHGEVTNDFNDDLKIETSGRKGSITGKQGSNSPEIKADTDRGPVTLKKS